MEVTYAISTNGNDVISIRSFALAQTSLPTQQAVRGLLETQKNIDDVVWYVYAFIGDNGKRVIFAF